MLEKLKNVVDKDCVYFGKSLGRSLAEAAALRAALRSNDDSNNPPYNGGAWGGSFSSVSVDSRKNRGVNEQREAQPRACGVNPLFCSAESAEEVINGQSGYSPVAPWHIRNNSENIPISASGDHL